MIMNMESESNEKRFTNVKGIGLYKINYEMDVKGDSNAAAYTAGIIAYSNEEAVQTLTDFCSKNVKGFKGMKINELAFEGLCHAMSEKVETAIINKALAAGTVVDASAVDKPAKAKKAPQKRSILPKE